MWLLFGEELLHPITDVTTLYAHIVATFYSYKKTFLYRLKSDVTKHIYLRDLDETLFCSTYTTRVN